MSQRGSLEAWRSRRFDWLRRLNARNPMWKAGYQAALVHLRWELERRAETRPRTNP